MKTKNKLKTENVVSNEKFFSDILAETKPILERYVLNSEKLSQLENKLLQFYVRTPLIGIFSSGKTSLINAVIEENIFPVDITPETNHPVELHYGQERKFIASYPKINISTKVTEDDIKNNKWLEKLNKKVGGKNNKENSGNEGDLDITGKCHPLLKVALPSEILKRFKSIHLIDIPGLDSSKAGHDAVISREKNALAYLVIVSADEGTLKTTMCMIIRELVSNQIPVGLIITKADKCEKEKLNQVRKHIKSEINKLTGVDPIFVATASARKNNISEVINGLSALEELAEQLYEKNVIRKFCELLNEVCKDIELLAEKCSMEIVDFDKEIQDKENRRDKLNHQVDEVINEAKNDLHNSNEEILQTVLNEVKNRRNDMVRLVLDKNKEAKDELEEIVTASARIGLNNARRVIIEPLYKKMLERIQGAFNWGLVIDHKDENISFDIVNDVGNDGNLLLISQKYRLQKDV